MKEILKRLDDFPDFTVIVFDDVTIVEKPIEEWPICDCLISFFSTGFPLKKVLHLFLSPFLSLPDFLFPSIITFNFILCFSPNFDFALLFPPC